MHVEKSTYTGGPPRILHLVHGMDVGGIEKWLLAALQEMPRDEFAMDICYEGPREGDLANQARATGAQLFACPLSPTLVPFVQRLKTILVRGGYSLLHVHTGAHSGLAVYAASTVGIPAVATYHNADQRPQTRLTRLPVVRAARAVYARWSMRYALQKTSVCNAVSQGVVEAVNQAAGLTQSSCEVLHLGSARPPRVSQERAMAYRRELGLGLDTRVVVHVGSFRDEKNHFGLLQAFREVIDSVPNTTLLLIGDGPLRPVIEKQISQLGLNERVLLLGKRSDATELMQLGEVFFFPSLSEGLSVAMMEAAAAGVPIVASDIPGNCEATANGSSALLHDLTDIDGMAKSIIDLLQDPNCGRHRAELGRKLYEQTFSIEASVGRLMTLYHGVLGTKSRTHLASRRSA